jgi:hypothetical protein
VWYLPHPTVPPQPPSLPLDPNFGKPAVEVNPGLVTEPVPGLGALTMWSTHCPPLRPHGLTPALAAPILLVLPALSSTASAV